MRRLFPQEDCFVEGISPYRDGGGTYDLVEQMDYFFVRIMEAKNLPPKDITGSCNPYVEVRLGQYKGTTSHFEQRTDPEWNQLFVLLGDQNQASTIKVVVKDKYVVYDDFIGMVEIDVDDIPRRVGPDSALAPQWLRLEDQEGDKVNGELCLTVWIGTQTDEAFPMARHLNDPGNTGSRVYLSPKLWYVRVNVINALDLMFDRKDGYHDVLVRASIGNQVHRTRLCECRNRNPVWNEDMMFVAAEPFKESLVISVEDKVGPAKYEVLGKTYINLQNVERMLDNKKVTARPHHLQKHVVMEEGDQEVKTTGQISLEICLDGRYHVVKEEEHYSSDLRPSAKELWKPSIGLVELGILGAMNLIRMKANEGRTTDAYCVATYGNKWVRTRTVINSLDPRWNEQYSWEVYDPETVITVGVFDNSHPPQGGAVDGKKDGRIGKVRIRLSTLETGRVYDHSYPLLVLHPSGLKKMGEIRLAVRFTCFSMLRMMHMYTQPLLPKMHYLQPFSIAELESLRYQAMQIISTRLSGEEPPLKKEVVKYITGVVDSQMWSMRRSKVNFFRIMDVLSSSIEVIKGFDEICNWKNPSKTVVIHLVFVILVLSPELIFPGIFFYLFLDCVWDRRSWPRHPPHVDTKLSYAELVHDDELDEEFDTYPTSQPPHIVRARYDRLRYHAARLQTIAGDLATRGEMLQSLSSGRDPRVTNLFAVFCLLLTIILYFSPRIVALLTGFYVMRHPRFRQGLPSVPLNFFRRLPSKQDMLL